MFPIGIHYHKDSNELYAVLGFDGIGIVSLHGDFNRFVLTRADLEGLANEMGASGSVAPFSVMFLVAMYQNGLPKDIEALIEVIKAYKPSIRTVRHVVLKKGERSSAWVFGNIESNEESPELRHFGDAVIGVMAFIHRGVITVDEGVALLQHVLETDLPHQLVREIELAGNVTMLL